MTANPLNLDCFVLPGKLPAGAHIAAAVLVERMQCADLLAAAHAEAEHIQAQALAVLDQARQDAIAIQQDAHRRADETFEALCREAQEKAAAEAVQWLCEEQDLEQQIADQVSLRWRHLTAQVLGETIGKHDQTDILIRRVERKVNDLLSHGQIMIYVAPVALVATKQRFAETAQILVATDEQLSEGQARLETHLLHVHIDLPLLQRELLAQLAGESRRQAHA
jgi:hypothetical protein